MQRKKTKNTETSDTTKEKSDANNFSTTSLSVSVAENIMSDVPPDNLENYAEPSLLEPLGEFASRAEHLRRLCGDMIEATKSGGVNAALVARIIDGLKVDIPNQFGLEAGDLFPLLRSRARKDDDFEAVMNILVENHTLISALVRQVIPRIEAFRLASSPASDDRILAEGLTEVAARLHRHVSLLNAVILPIARLRFGEEDLHALAEGLGDASSSS